MNKLIIKQVINSNLAVSSSQAEQVFLILESNFRNEEKTSVDFSGIDTLTTAFLNTAIGQLYTIGEKTSLNKYIQIKGETLTPLQRDKVRLVMDNAKNKLSNDEIREEFN